MKDINLKGVALVILSMVVIVFATMWVRSVKAQTKTDGVLSELDKNVLLRTDAQLQLLQQKFQKEAAPIVEEQTALLKKKCGEVKATPGTDCEVNIQAGIVKKQAPAVSPAQTPAAKPAK